MTPPTESDPRRAAPAAPAAGVRVPLASLALNRASHSLAQPGPTLQPLRDGEARQVRYLRLSVTDRCNLRCVYCMPDGGLAFRPKAEILTFDENVALVRAFVALGITRVRLTGGEPLLRRDLPDLVARIAAIPGIEDISLSTNGDKLAAMAEPLRAAGVDRVNISLDTLDPERFRAITRVGDLARVLAGIDAAFAAGFAPVKLNVVVMRDQNLGELAALVAFAAARGAILRFIEAMPVGVDEFWSENTFVPVAEIRRQLSAHYFLGSQAGFGPDVGIAGGGPARYAVLEPKDRSHAPVQVGFITAVSDHFCASCNRVRLTATGTLQECLAFPGSLSLRDALRAGASQADLQGLIASALRLKGAGHSFGTGQRTYQSMSITGG